LPYESFDYSRVGVIATAVFLISSALIFETVRLLNAHANRERMAKTWVEVLELYLNTQASRMFGYESGALLQQPIDPLVPQSARVQHAHHRRTYATSPSSRNMGAGVALVGRRRDGTEFPIDVLLKPGAGDVPSATIAIVRDRTTVHATLAAHENARQALIDKVPLSIAYFDTEERLQFSNSVFREMVSAKSDLRGMTVRSVVGEDLYEVSTEPRRRGMAGSRASSIIAVLVDGNLRQYEITYAPDFDPAGCALLGYMRAELLGLTFVGLLPPGDRERLALTVTELQTSGSTRGEWLLKHKQGHYVAVELTGQRLPDGRLIGFVRDNTERLRLGEALSRARDAAIQANEVKSRFLAAASHDLCQPLQTIWRLQAVLFRSLQDSPHASHLALLEDAIRSMDQTLGALMDINRLEKGAIEPAIRDFPLQEILATLRSEFAYSANDKALALEIPQSDEYVRSDPMLLPVILRNLIGNAIKYTIAGKVQLRVRSADDQLFIDVRDIGPGIAPEHLQRLSTHSIRWTTRIATSAVASDWVCQSSRLSA
jgi:PAS domain S-box-containing protein